MKLNLAKTSRQLDSLPRSRVVVASIAAILTIGVIDHLSGPITSLTIFYLIPVALTTWVAGRRYGNALAVFAGLVWAVADRFGPYAEPRAALAYWNDASIVVVFVFINSVLDALHEQLRAEHAMLQGVQRRLLPAQPPRLPGLELAWRWEPAWTVAGDYYDLIDAGNGRYAICVADVSGKGMPAALIMSNVQATVQALTAGGLEPARVATMLNEILQERLRRGSFVTMFYGLLDPQSGELAYVNAGHNPPLLGTTRLDSTGPVLGVVPNAVYRTEKVTLAKGAELVLYSDGVTEHENGAGEQFGEQRLREAIGSAPSHDAEALCDRVLSTLQKFGNGRPYGDDVTLVVVTRRG